MNKTITMYELLGLVKDGKAPKKIKYAGYEYSYYEDEDNNFKNYDCAGKDWLINQFIYQKINDTVEILEEEKKIPEKIKDILKIDDLIPPVDVNF